MLLAVFFVYQIIATLASPLDQYPLVFLLNIGNEEIDNTNTERIRVSLPGGSFALRYPAIGYGDRITNVKVIGINSVENLKANIVEGGPGSNYVVLALSGNSAEPYDVLLDIQTVPYTVNVFENAKAIQNDISDPYGLVFDKNDSAEDTIDEETPNNKRNMRMNAELTQETSDIAQHYNIEDNRNDENINYENYLDTYNIDDDNEFENEVNLNADDEENDTDDTDDPAYALPDIHRPTPEQFPGETNVSVKTSVNDIQNSPCADQFPDDDKYSDDDYDDMKVKVNNLFKSYETSHANYDKVIQVKDKYDQENGNDRYEDDPTEIDQMFNDEEVHDKYSYSNKNNSFDADDTSAVEY